jgi:membrane protease YdiL (CAAX protease family)
VTEQVAPPAGLRVPSWGFGDVALTLLGAILIGNILVLALLPDTSSPTFHATVRDAWAALVVLLGPWLALAGWPLVATRLRGNGPVRDLALRTSWRSAAIGVAFGVAGLASAYLLVAVQQQLTHQEVSSRAADVAHDLVAPAPAALALFALATAFGAPVVEELAFRGLTYGAFVKRGVPPLWSVLGTAVLFALFHFELQRVLVLAVLGIWIGAVRAVTGSTTASMAAHMAINVPGAIGILLLH